MPAAPSKSVQLGGGVTPAEIADTAACSVAIQIATTANRSTKLWRDAEHQHVKSI
jgi:hypothetical protein